MSIDHQLSRQLRALADHEPDSAPPTRVLLERGRLARRRRTATLTGVTVAASVVVAVATGFVALQPSHQGGAPGAARSAAVTQEGTPRLRLAAAVTASGSTSYAFTISMVAKPVEGAALTADERALVQRLTKVPRTAKGEFDPAATTGVLVYADGSEQRLVNGQRFIGDGRGQWKHQNDGRHEALTFSGFGTEAFTVSSDPAQLLQTLRQAGTVTEASPGVYRFEVPGTDVQGNLPAATGEVTVTGGKVAKVTYDSPLFEAGPEDHLFAAVTVEFADYGRTVTVRQPATWVD